MLNKYDHDPLATAPGFCWGIIGGAILWGCAAMVAGCWWLHYTVGR